jgi:hypothetical protein
VSKNQTRFLGWWALVLAGAALALLIVWLTRVVSVRLTAVLTVGAVVLGLSWLVVVVTVPWNLYFGARRAQAGMAVSRERGIAVRAADDAEAGRLARRMLAFAIGAHLGSALVAALLAYFLADRIGYYVAGFFLLATVVRPAMAYFGHVRARITVLARESTHPREDVATLRAKVTELRQAVTELRSGLAQGGEDLRRAEARLADGIGHARDLLSADLGRLRAAQETDRADARSRSEDLGRALDQMVRRIELTLDGLSDQQDVLTGLRALVRMVRSDEAPR